MASIIKVQDIQNSSGANIINESSNTITIGASGDTISVPSGATFDVSNATVNGIQAGITMADHWRLTSTLTISSPTTITTNLARFSGDGYGGIGTGMTESSGTFTFPSTGVYYVTMKAIGRANGGTRSYAGCSIRTTTDGGSSFSNFSFANNDCAFSSSHFSAFTQAVIDVTDTSQVKVAFRLDASNSCLFDADATQGYTQMTFIRLGDT